MSVLLYTINCLNKNQGSQKNCRNIFLKNVVYFLKFYQNIIVKIALSHETFTWPESNNNLVTHFLGKAPVLLHHRLSCFSLLCLLALGMSRNGKMMWDVALVSNSIPTLWYYKMFPSNDSIKQFHKMISLNNFHNMESTMESWRLCTRHLWSRTANSYTTEERACPNRSREHYTYDIFRGFLWIKNHHYQTKIITLCITSRLEVTGNCRRWRSLVINVHNCS